MDHQRHEGHDDHHDRRQRVDEEADLDLEPTGDHPRVDGEVIDGAVDDRVLERDARQHERAGDGEDRQPMAAGPADPALAEAGDGGRDERQQHDGEVDRLHPCISSMSSTLMLARLRNSTTSSASPIAASAAATVRMKNTNTWPPRSPRNAENATKLMFTASSISSMHIRSTITLRRFRNMPATEMLNRMPLSTR